MPKCGRDCPEGGSFASYELTSQHFLNWGIEWKLELPHIQRGKPVQNAHVESYDGKLRDECLNVSWFRNL